MIRLTLFYINNNVIQKFTRFHLHINLDFDYRRRGYEGMVRTTNYKMIIAKEYE